MLIGVKNCIVLSSGCSRGMGIIIAISISKIKNKTASRKNCREKGSRAELCGSNPHSNGEDFSREG